MVCPAPAVVSLSHLKRYTRTEAAGCVDVSQYFGSAPVVS